MPKKIQLLDSTTAEQRLTRLAYEIYENNIDEKEINFIGIEDRGVDIAKILKKKIESISELKIELATLIVDKLNPVDCQFGKDFNPKGKTIIIIDDVANSGKTMFYAIKPLLDQIANKIQIAVLIDRQHKKFPIASDYIGLQLSTTLQDHITVEIEKGKVIGAYIE
jgi:pyrimidine operon attenuation protein/uracil phosphoribosyltransferase